jgi:uncharacterized protein (TIGR00106 family)
MYSGDRRLQQFWARAKLRPMATADLTVITVGREGAGAGDVMAEIHRRLERQDAVRFQMHAMGTSLEGAVEDILRIAGELHAVPFELDAPRVYTVLKLDERRDRPQGLEDKMESVRARLLPDRSRDYPPGD